MEQWEQRLVKHHAATLVRWRAPQKSVAQGDWMSCWSMACRCHQLAEAMTETCHDRPLTLMAHSLEHTLKRGLVGPLRHDLP